MTAMVNRALGSAPRIPWSGTVHRSHGPRWSGDNAGGSLLVSGRWHIGMDDPASRQPFPALYTATSQVIATWERLRHLDERSIGAMKGSIRVALSRLEVMLPSVLDLRGPAQFGIPPDLLLGTDYDEPQQIAAAAYADGLAGLLVPTATGLGATDGDFNVIVFYEVTGASTPVYGLAIPTTVPRAGSTIRVVGVEEPNLPP